MEQVPEFWRTEVYHPLSVHFPIALLLAAFVFKLVALKYRREVWVLGGSILLITGTLGLWMAIYTGSLADPIVTRKLCDPTILEEHENWAYFTGWVFLAASILELLPFVQHNFIIRKIRLLTLLTVLLMAIGAAAMTYVGHLGATLVYQQAAGVYTPSEDCGEFN